MGFTSKVWKKDETAALIALFETERSLYDPSDRDYRDPNKQLEAYERICKIMYRIRPDVTVDEIKYKIKVLKKQYEGELLHRNISIETGLCTVDSYKTGMWCFGLLQFLDDYLDVKSVDEITRNYEDSDKEAYDTSEKDHQKEAEGCSDLNDDSDEQEEIEERIRIKKRKVERSSSSSSDRESLNSTIRKYLNSTSEKKIQNSSVSVKKFHSASSSERKLHSSSNSARKSHSSFSTEKKIQKSPSYVKKSQHAPPPEKKSQPIPPPEKRSQPIPSLEKKSQPAPPPEKKSQTTIFHEKKSQTAPLPEKKAQSTQTSQKKFANSSSSKKVQCPSPSERKSFSFENDRKSSSERELNNSTEKEFEEESNQHVPDSCSKSQPPSEKKTKRFSATAKDAKMDSLERELFSTPLPVTDVVSETNSAQISIDREDIFGRYVACELRALRNNPIIYLQTKQSILESITNANFELFNPE